MVNKKGVKKRETENIKIKEKQVIGLNKFVLMLLVLGFLMILISSFNSFSLNLGLFELELSEIGMIFLLIAGYFYFASEGNPFSKSFEFLKKIKVYFWFSFILFIVIFIFGLAYPYLLNEQILEIIKQLISQTEGLSSIELIKFIMFNNIRSSFFATILGVFLGILPLFVIVSNAYILGFVSNSVVIVEGSSVLLRLLPHGIFEIPAVMISAAMGIMLGISLIKNCILFYAKGIPRITLYSLIFLSIIFFPISIFILFALLVANNKLRQDFLLNFKDSLRLFLFIVIPLLIIAGIIEGSLIFVLG